MRELKKDIYWVGYIDWDLKSFHGYLTQRGSTYNSYLIVDEKIVLVDTVKKTGFNEFLGRIKEIVDPVRIDFIVANHAERDHAGSLPEMAALAPNAKILVSPAGQKNLDLQFHQKLNYQVVADGQILNVGKKNLKFIHTPMVHWPDSMVSLLVEDEILFSNDSFGQHIASAERFADEFGLDVVFEEAAKYYANIVLPYGDQVKKEFEKLKDVSLSMIAPAHGLVWRGKEVLQRLFGLYQKWADYQSDRRVVIVFDSMWDSTRKIARAFKDTLEKENILVDYCDLETNHISEIMARILSARVILLGTAVLNNQMLPPVAAFLTYLRGLKPRKRSGLTFGSYGWAQLAFAELEKGLAESGAALIDKGIYFQYVPEDGPLEASIRGILPGIKKALDSSV